MVDDQSHEPDSPNASHVQPAETAPSPYTPPDDVHQAFDRLESLLKKIHGTLDTQARELEHRDWSYLRTTGVILEIVVAGLFVLALFDLILYGPVNPVMIKLAFAGVLQLGALTAFVISGNKR